MSEFPFAGREFIAQAEVVRFIANVVYPDDDLSDACSRIRKRIEDHERRGLLTRAYRENGKWFLDAKSFFEWACNQTPWVCLRTIAGIPKRPIIADVNETVGLSASFHDVFIPPADKIQDAYVEQASLIDKFKMRIIELEKIIEKRKAQTAKARRERKKTARRLLISVTKPKSPPIMEMSAHHELELTSNAPYTKPLRSLEEWERAVFPTRDESHDLLRKRLEATKPSSPLSVIAASAAAQKDQKSWFFYEYARK